MLETDEVSCDDSFSVGGTAGGLFKKIGNERGMQKRANDAAAQRALSQDRLHVIALDPSVEMLGCCVFNTFPFRSQLIHPRFITKGDEQQ